MKDKELIKAWIEALRSGEYKQGKNRLRTIDDDGEISWCCLGVLCDVAIKAGKLDAKWEGQGLRVHNYDSLWYNYPSTRWMMDGLGFESSNPPVEYINKEGQKSKANLSDVNDFIRKDEFDNRFSFDDIATLIEENYV